MTTVGTHCTFCSGQLVLPAHEVLLTLHPGQSWRDTYRFVCPRCFEENVTTAGPGVVELLLRAPVRVERRLVADLADDRGRHPSHPLAEDDVAEFLQALDASEALEDQWGP